MLCFCFVFLRLVYPMLPVSLGCVVFLLCFSTSCVPYVTSFSRLCCVFALFFYVLCTLCYQFLWIFRFLLALWYSLMFIYNSFKIPKRKLETFNRRKTNTAMVKRKRTKGQTIMFKKLHRKLKIEQHEPH